MTSRMSDAGPTRRVFVGTGLAAGLSASGLAAAARRSVSAPTPRRARRMLILGGTRFLGPQIVRAAEAAGYEVTLFNRGKSDAERFARLEQLRGDRDTGDLAALEQGEWDVCVDTSGYAPLHVAATAGLLKDRVQHYVFVSTVSVYADQSAAVVAEDTPVGQVTDDEVAAATTIGIAGRKYGPMKARCEAVAEAAMPGRVANLRPGLIVGPEDRSDRFTYWPVRVGQGGEVLAPGNPVQEVQFIDVRDLGDYCVLAGANRIAGPRNAVGFRMRLGFEEFLHGCKCALNADASFTWVGEEFLTANKVRPYMEMPLWLPAGMRGHFAGDRAFADGMRCRPVSDTVQATAAWFAEQWPAGRDWNRAGMKPVRERELLAKWRESR